MSTWVIISWIFVAILTAINVFIFLKLKGASEQMMKMAFPGAKDMGAAMEQMQKMMGGMGGGGKPGHGGQRAMPQMGRGQFKGGGKNPDAQLKAAMDMLANIQKGNKR